MYTKKEIQELINKGRSILKYDEDKIDPEYQSDQDLKRPQPPLVKEDMTENAFDLPRNFDELDTKLDLTTLLTERKSSRVYTEENLTLLQLSYLLWATQGIKAVRGKKYATLRTVPCGGARHEFETYMLVKHVEGLEPGLYHYLPWGHRMEKLGEVEDMDKTLNDSLVGQSWGVHSSVVFFWSVVCYRAEWRYGVSAHRIILVDIGHVGENMYLASNALGLGTCGLGAFDRNLCNKLFGLDGEEEFILYTQTVGTVKADDKYKEDAFYQFVLDEGL